MSRSLYELCCRYANGELDIYEYRQLRRRFIDDLVSSSDRTQPATELPQGEVTQPHFLLTLAADSMPPEEQQDKCINPSGRIADTQVPAATSASRSVVGKWLMMLMCLLVAGAVIWYLNMQKSGRTAAQLPGDQSLTTEHQPVVPLLNNMYILLDQDKWSGKNIDDYSVLLQRSTPAERSALKSDSRYHQFLDSVHVYQVLAEADQNEVLVAKLARLEQQLRD